MADIETKESCPVCTPDSNPAGTKVNFISRTGYIYDRGNYQFVIDLCADNDEHMAASAPPGDDRRRCRQFLHDLIPESWRNKKGRIVITALFTPDPVPTTEREDVDELPQDGVHREVEQTPRQ